MTVDCPVCDAPLAELDDPAPGGQRLHVACEPCDWSGTVHAHTTVRQHRLRGGQGVTVRVRAADGDGITEYELPAIYPTVYQGDRVTIYWQDGCAWREDEDLPPACAIFNHTSDTWNLAHAFQADPRPAAEAKLAAAEAAERERADAELAAAQQAADEHAAWERAERDASRRALRRLVFWSVALLAAALVALGLLGLWVWSGIS